MSSRRTKDRLTRRGVLYGGTALIGAAATSRLWRPGPAFAAEPRPGGTVRISVTQQMTTLIPFKQGNNPEYMTGEMMYSGLVRVGPDMVPAAGRGGELDGQRGRERVRLQAPQGGALPPRPRSQGHRTRSPPSRRCWIPETASPGRKNVGPDQGHRRRRRLHGAHCTLDGSFADLPVTMGHPSAKIVPGRRSSRRDSTRWPRETTAAARSSWRTTTRPGPSRSAANDGYHVRGAALPRRGRAAPVPGPRRGVRGAPQPAKPT